MAIADYFDRFLDSVDGYVISTQGGNDTETYPPTTGTGVTPGTESGSMFGGVSGQAMVVGGVLFVGVLLLALRK